MEFNNNKGEIEFPYQIKPVDPEINEEMLKDFTGEKNGYVQVHVGDDKYFFPGKYAEFGPSYYNFEARSDDIWVTSFPRSGTTWTQELVWMVANDLNYKGAQKEPLTKRFPFFEFPIFLHDDVKKELLELNKDSPENQSILEAISQHSFESFQEITTRRFIKTHFPFSLLPPSVLENGAKVVYVARNPKDVAVSCYYLNRLFRTQGYTGDFPKYWSYFERNLCPWMPYWAHVKEAYTYRNHPNVLFLFYENMIKDLPGTIKKVAEFLGKNYTDEQIDKLTDYLSIHNFKNNPAVNGKELIDLKIQRSDEQGFVRRGKSGGNQEYTPELNKRAEKWIQENSKGMEFQFPTV